MSEDTTTQIKWIEKNVVPQIAKSLGRESDNVRCDISFPKNCLFLSSVCFLDLKFGNSVNNDDAKNENIFRLVIKRPPANPTILKYIDMMKQFHNEILFYTKFSTGNSRFPRVIYTHENNIDDTVVVLENLDIQGYGICPKNYDIPVEYVYSAVNEIARLHAAAYAMKELETEKFYNIVSEIRESRFNDNEIFGTYVNIIATRPIDWLRRNNCEKEFCDKLERHFGNGFSEFMVENVKPVEPLATLCHGDFTRNNIFFRKYNDKLEAKLFDFALITYSSPAIDLSTFLFMSCSAKDRVEKFNDIYRSYHDTLIENLHNLGINDIDKYSYENMLADYKRRAAFGYMVATFFLPVTRGVVRVEYDTSFDDPIASAFKTREAGGEAMTEIFGKMILELRDLGCFDHLL